jgi:CRISPR-associated protein Csd1
MIIQELCHYYDRLAENPNITISPPGFSREKIHAEIVLDKEGNLLQFNDLRIQKGKKLVPREMIVPQSCKRPGSKPYEKPFFLLDNTGFVLGQDTKNDENTPLKHEHFISFHQDLLNNCRILPAQSLLKFLSTWKPENAERLAHWKDLVGGNVGFRIEGEHEYLHDKKELKAIWQKNLDIQQSGSRGYCLVTGQTAPIAQTHPAVKGVAKAQTSGAALISFNDKAYESYGKKQNYNAPVGEIPAFSYTTSLNYLLANDSRQKIQIGDATTVFWTERESPIEGMFGMMLDPKDSDISDNAELRQELESVREGKPLVGIDQEIRFFILGLSPNAARIAVRFWYVCTVGQLKEKIGQHFRDLQIQKGRDTDSEFPGIWRLLRETVNQKASDKSPQPLLAGAVLKAILEGTAYPQSLQNAVISRIRADQEINYVRAAILKAILVRKYRLNKQRMEVSMALDTENKNHAYLLGRLFATLEKAQQEASPGINATIKDRFWGSASATPKVAFPQLLNLNNHHISKIDNPGKAMFFKKLNGDIMDGIVSTGFKAHLTLDEQGLFAIGYYHQRQDFFKGKDERKDNQ